MNSLNSNSVSESDKLKGVAQSFFHRSTRFAGVTGSLAKRHLAKASRRLLRSKVALGFG
jgi:hypothetical protein